MAKWKSYKRKFSYSKYKKSPDEWLKHDGIKDMKCRQFIKNQLINSKGAVCGICGKPIENMKDCTIDHIIPISKGGQTTLENCQLAHFKCNQDKGNN